MLICRHSTMQCCQFLILFFTILFVEASTKKLGTKGFSAETRLIKKMLEKYEKEAPGNGPTTVELGIYINSIDSVNEQSMEYTMNIYLRQSWRDPRLRFEPLNNKSHQVIKLRDGMWNKIWVPDVFFRNEKRAGFHDVTVPNRLIRLHSNGVVWYATKLTVTLSCMMDLKKYPLDTQRCPILFESFGYTRDTVDFAWLTSFPSVEREKTLILPQFIWQNYTRENCSQSYATGDYPCLKLTFIMKRNIGFYFIQLYVPSSLVIVLSWVSFWISIDAVPARITIGLLTVLTMTTQSTYATAQLPRVSYIKAIDVWMSACLLFVFSSLIEYAFVNVCSRRHETILRKKKQAMQDKNSGQTMPFLANNGGATDAFKILALVGAKNNACYIDKLSRVLFPVTFLVFNVTYWTVYLFLIDDSH